MTSLENKPHNRCINHVALSCIDLEKQVAWYTKVLGFELLGEIRHFKRSEDPVPFDTIFVSYPKDLRELKFAILTSGNGVGIECFEFIEPACRAPEESFEYARAGFFHVCITDPNPETLVEKILAEGGQTLGDYMEYSIYGLQGHKGIYTQDPWGNIIEIMSLSLERVASTGEALNNAAQILPNL